MLRSTFVVLTFCAMCGPLSAPFARAAPDAATLSPSAETFRNEVRQACEKVVTDEGETLPSESVSARLIRLGKIDQCGRNLLGKLDFTSLPPAEQKPGRASVLDIIHGYDRDVEKQFKLLVPAAGWFVISKYGAGASKAAFLIVQHVNNDIEFMKMALNRMAPLVGTADLDGQDYGLLYDRIAMMEGRPQKYGTQMVCVSGRYQPYTLEDPSKVNQYRTNLGMKMTLEQYVHMFDDNAPCVSP